MSHFLAKLRRTPAQVAAHWEVVHNGADHYFYLVTDGQHTDWHRTRLGAEYAAHLMNSGDGVYLPHAVTGCKVQPRAGADDGRLADHADAAMRETLRAGHTSPHGRQAAGVSSLHKF